MAHFVPAAHRVGGNERTGLCRPPVRRRTRRFHLPHRTGAQLSCEESPHNGVGAQRGILNLANFKSVVPVLKVARHAAGGRLLDGKVVWPLEVMGCGQTEFGIRDPNGYTLGFSEAAAEE